MENEIKARKSGFTLSHLALLFGAFLVVLRLLRARRATDFRARVVLITGGSRGLGLNIARQFASENARLALVARSENDLEKAKAELEAEGAEVFTFVADVTDKAQAEAAVAATVKRFGGLDVLVNNAGMISFGPVEHMSEADFRKNVELHIFAPLNLTRAAIPHLKRSGGARVINIASIGGLLAVPQMAPYAASKFGTVGLSDALRHELAKDGILVTTVCPGMIRTGSHLAAKFKGNHKLQYGLFKLGAGLPFSAVEAPVAAKMIVEAARHGDPCLVFPLPMFWATIAYRAFPNLSGLVFGLVGRFMPPPTSDESGDEEKSGHQIEPEIPRSPLTALADKAAIAHNELNGHAPEKAKTL